MKNIKFIALLFTIVSVAFALDATTVVKWNIPMKTSEYPALIIVNDVQGRNVIMFDNSVETVNEMMTRFGKAKGYELTFEGDVKAALKTDKNKRDLTLTRTAVAHIIGETRAGVVFVRKTSVQPVTK